MSGISRAQADGATLLQDQKMKAVGQLAGGIAHDFNNILAAILLNVSLLLEDTRLGIDVRNSLEEVLAEAKRAADLTRQLLLFTRQQVMQFQPVDLNQALNGLSKLLRRLLGEHIELEFVPANPLPKVLADPSMVEQIALNLSVNARDAMPKGGRLTLATRLVEFGASNPPPEGEARPGRFVCLTVRDTGCGMDEATLKRLFEPFFTTKEVGQGTGLGLATVYGIVQQHRGWTEVQSAVGQGATFRVFLTVAPEAGAREQPAPAMSAPRGSGETILLVEDEPSVRVMAARCPAASRIPGARGRTRSRRP